MHFFNSDGDPCIRGASDVDNALKAKEAQILKGRAFADASKGGGGGAAKKGGEESGGASQQQELGGQ